MHNLANDTAAQKVRSEMEKRLVHWMEETGDRWDYNWTAAVEDNGRLYRHRTFYSVPEYLEWARESRSGCGKRIAGSSLSGPATLGRS
jgi:hypothetical protein